MNFEGFIRKLLASVFARKYRGRGLCLRACLLFACGCLGYPATGNAEIAAEYDLKAAFLYNFSTFVTWPRQHNPFVICVYGDNPFNAALEALLAEKSTGLAYQAVYPSSREALHACQVLYIGRSKGGELREILAGLRSQPILTVGDFETNDAATGVMINLVANEQRIGFEINRSAAQTAGLQIDSKLLALAKRVY